MKNCLIIMAKSPRLGLVKTRLAASIGNEAALSVHKRLYDLTIRQCAYPSWETIIFASEQCQDFDMYELPVVIQARGDLGVRLKHALTFGMHQSSQVCIIGSDCPALNADIIKSSFEGLADKDVILGPADDGGYYLIASRVKDKDIFNQISWSTENVLSQTIQQVMNKGLSYNLLPMLSDIDTIEDLRKWEMTGDKLK